MSMRPGGVTVIGIIFLAIGVAALIEGIVFVIMPADISDWYNANIGPMLAGLPIAGSYLADLSASTFRLFGFAAIALGAIYLLTSIGVLKLTKWGYWIAILASIVLIVVIVGILFIWYLRKEEVKAAFDIS